MDSACRVTVGVLSRPSTDPKALIAMELARTEINANQDLIPDCTLYMNILEYDSTDTMIVAASALLGVTGRSAVVAIIGADNSPDSEVLRPLMKPHNMPQIAFSSASEKLNPSTANPTMFFRTCPSNDRLLKVAAQLVQTFGWKEISVISSENRRSGMDYFKDQASTYGYTVFGAVDNVFAYSTDAEREAARLQLRELVRETYSTVFLMIVPNDETWPLMQVAFSAGLVRSGYTWLNAYTLLDVPSGSVNGTSIAWTTLAQGMFCIHQEIDSATWAAFNDKLNQTATLTAGYAYDSIYMLAEAITRAVGPSSGSGSGSSSGSALPIFSEAGTGLVQNPDLLAPFLRASDFSFQSAFQPTATLSTTDSSPEINVQISNYDSEQWNIVGTSLAANTTLSVDMDAVRFSDGTSIVPHYSSMLVVGVLVDDKVELSSTASSDAFKYARGAEARPAIAAAIDYIAEKDLFEGYNFAVQIEDASCNVGNALVAYSNLQAFSPLAVVGGGCDSSTDKPQQIAESKEQVLLGWGAATNALDGADYYLSLSESYSSSMSSFLELSVYIGLTFVGLVKDNHWSSTAQFYELAEEFGCLVKTVTTIDSTENTLTVLNDAYWSSASAFLAILSSEYMASVVTELPDSDVYSGYIWFAPQLLMDSVTDNLAQNGLADSVSGWFTLNASLDTTQSTYQEFLKLYDDNRAADSPDPTYHSAAVFNGVLAVAQAASALFNEKIYTSNENFGTLLHSKIKDVDLERNVTGAGMTLTFADNGIGHVPFDLLNWGSGGASSLVAQYNTRDGFIVPDEDDDDADDETTESASGTPKTKGSTRRSFTLSASFANYLTALLTSNSSSGSTVSISFTGILISDSVWCVLCAQWCVLCAQWCVLCAQWCVVCAQCYVRNGVCYACGVRAPAE